MVCVPLFAGDVVVAFEELTDVAKNTVPTATVKIDGELSSEKNSVSNSIMFNGQAGEGQKPGYTIDGKIQMSHSIAGTRLFFKPQVMADLGYRSSDNAKKADALKGGFGLSYGLANIWTVFTASAIYETDRIGTHRNLIGDTKMEFSSSRS